MSKGQSLVSKGQSLVSGGQSLVLGGQSFVFGDNPWCVCINTLGICEIDPRNNPRRSDDSIFNRGLKPEQRTGLATNKIRAFARFLAIPRQLTLFGVSDSSRYRENWHYLAWASGEVRSKREARSSTRNRMTGKRSASYSAAEKIDRARALDLRAFVRENFRPREHSSFVRERVRLR